jgi:hypothetical protein
MFKVICTDNNKCYKVYSVLDRKGIADFLIYNGHNWQWISELHCRPAKWWCKNGKTYKDRRDSRKNS